MEEKQFIEMEAEHQETWKGTMKVIQYWDSLRQRMAMNQ